MVAEALEAADSLETEAADRMLEKELVKDFQVQSWMTEYPILAKREREEAQVVVLGKRNINNIIQKQP